MKETRAGRGEPSKSATNGTRWLEVQRAAEIVFLERGYKDATVEEIASRVGLLSGSLYHYIRNKEDLFYQVLSHANARHVQLLRDDSEINEGEPPARLSHFIDRHIELFHRDPRWNSLYERDQVFLSSAHRESLDALRHEVHSLLKRIIMDGMADESFDSDLDATAAAYSILLLLNGQAWWNRPADRRSLPEITAWYRRFILNALATGTPP